MLDILPSISGTCETQKDYCCFSREERALSHLGSSACGEVYLGPDSSGLFIAPARHGFGKSLMGEQTIWGHICANMIHETMSNLFFFPSNKIRQRDLTL